MSVVNVVEESLVFPDNSQYRGQVLRDKYGDSQSSKPHGYGRMITKEGFEMIGNFSHGKACGYGMFRAPNGDEFYGHWNEDNKRDKRGLSLRYSEQKVFVDTYHNGKLLKRTKVGKVGKAGYTQWRRPQLKFADGALGPCARTGHSATIVGEGSERLLIVFGGLTTNDEGPTYSPQQPIIRLGAARREVVLNDVHVMDLSSKTWTQVAPAGSTPPPLHGHTATAVGKDLVIIGGQNGIEVSSAVYVLDTKLGKWTCPVTKGINFANHTATLVGDRIFVIVQSSVFALDLDMLQWQQCTVDDRAFRMGPRSFVGHSAVALGSMIVVHGGKILGGNTTVKGSDKVFQKCSNEVRILHTDTMAWEFPTVSPPPPAELQDEERLLHDAAAHGTWDCPRSDHSAMLVDDRFMYVFGGYTSCSPKVNVVDTGYLQDVQVLDLETMQWHTPFVPDRLCAPRSNHTTLLINGRLWVFGGQNCAFASLGDWKILDVGDDLRNAPSAKAKAADPPLDEAKVPAGQDQNLPPPQALLPQQQAKASCNKKPGRKTWGKPSAASKPWLAESGSVAEGVEGGELLGAGSGSVLDLFKGQAGLGGE